MQATNISSNNGTKVPHNPNRAKFDYLKIEFWLLKSIELNQCKIGFLMQV
jgi:hypothetical protein